MNNSVPRIAITPGEPAGIGPDLAVMLAQRDWPAEIIAVCDPTLLRERAKAIGQSLDILEFEADHEPEPHRSGTIKVFPLELGAPARCAHLDRQNAEYVLASLRRAADGCINQQFQALVTGPVHKGIINDAGIPFTGHTEFLAEHTGGHHPVMLLAAGRLRVALATTHLPLAAVSRAITRERLVRVIRILDRDLRERFGIEQPRILACGLNPHAGEGGHLGHEEVEIIAPALEALREEGIHLLGPLPADTLFTPRHLEHADAVLAMYHDQGLPVLKHVGFGNAVNITLGLPIIRTSVDHGTALDLAGTGQADVGSLKAALQLAAELATRARRRGALQPGR